ncbi:MAG: YkgJ family cysteine cluster protein [Pseudomonadota bacterium]
MDLSEFKCLGCGACCRQDGYVRLKKNEPDKIAAFLNMDVYDFIETCTVLTCDRHSLALKDKKNGECLFLTPGGCAINAVKPDQCLDFPHRWKFKAFKTTCAWAIQACKKD